MSKHTPGEWIKGNDPHPLSRSATLIASKTPDGECVLICEVHEFVPFHLSDVDVYDCTPDEAKANSHLIVASPSLLAALESVEWIQVFDQYGDKVGDVCPWCDEYRDDTCDNNGHADDCQRQVAIAKAKGGK